MSRNPCIDVDVQWLNGAITTLISIAPHRELLIDEQSTRLDKIRENNKDLHWEFDDEKAALIDKLMRQVSNNRISFQQAESVFLAKYRPAPTIETSESKTHCCECGSTDVDMTTSDDWTIEDCNVCDAVTRVYERAGHYRLN